MSKKYYLGIDIGTYETKGVLVNIRGEVISQSAKKHEMIVPQSGWAEHRPIEDWWGDFTFISNDLIKKSGCDGIVCSAQEAKIVRKKYKNLFI